MPMALAVRITRHAISPRLAIRIFLNKSDHLAARKGEGPVNLGRFQRLRTSMADEDSEPQGGVDPNIRSRQRSVGKDHRVVDRNGRQLPILRSGADRPQTLRVFRNQRNLPVAEAKAEVIAVDARRPILLKDFDGIEAAAAKIELAEYVRGL